MRRRKGGRTSHRGIEIERERSEFDPFRELPRIFPMGRVFLRSFMEQQTRLALLEAEANAFRSLVVNAQ